VEDGAANTYPDDPILALLAEAANETGSWVYIYDTDSRVIFASDEVKLTYGPRATAGMPLGKHSFGPEWLQFLMEFTGGGVEGMRQMFMVNGPHLLFELNGDKARLAELVAPELRDLVDSLDSRERPAVTWSRVVGRSGGLKIDNQILDVRILDPSGRFVGVFSIHKPAPGMSHLAAAAATANLGHLERTRLVERPDRRPAAILIADLEASSPLARRLSTAQYFAFGRRLVRAADQCIIDEGGIVGRHAGDGVTAFFLAETYDSESAAARSCIAASRALRTALPDVAARCDLAEAEVSLRFGLHWGSTLYVGRILTTGRSEVTALGDEVNETARIEACATGGRSLASKSLVERLVGDAAESLGIDPSHTTYTPLAELATATDKARRDAPSIAVCEV
jgi:class 3 adenylate cyclase